MLASKYLWGGLLLSVVTGCGPADEDVGGDGTGGTGAGTGGKSSGGAASGGAASGGAASGGSSKGGAASGGATTGGSASGGAATGGSGGAALPRKSGLVAFTQDKNGALLRAAFSNGSAGGGACVKVGSDICYANTCDPAPDDVPVDTNHPHAGTLTFTSADIAGSLSVGPNDEGDYGLSTNTFEAPFSGGEQGLVTASGGDVPAFEQAIEVPLALLLTQPAYVKDGPQVIPRESDLTLQWLRGADGVILNVQGSSSDRPDGMPGTVRLQCNFPSEEGAGVIPSAVLQALPSGMSVQARTMRYVPVTAGEYAVTVVAGYDVYNEAKDQIVDPIVE